jgi:hypothetical protein
MAVIASYTQQPADRLDYDIPCDLVSGDYITTAVASVEPSGLTVSSIVTDATTVKLWVEDGTAGTTYKIEVLITTNNGRKKEVEVKVRVKEF